MDGHSTTLIGTVNSDNNHNFSISLDGGDILTSQLGELRRAWQKTLDGGRP